MLVNLKELCEIAEKRNIAVGGFNALDIHTIKAVIRAAEKRNAPISLMFAQLHEKFTRVEDVAPLMLTYAREASVPVCVQLDHGEDLDYVRKALALGFTAVMFDGSDKPYEENAEMTAKVVKMARECGCSVEGELGSLGKREYGDGASVRDDTKTYTDPALAKQFVDETGIDALACSFGTTHGFYLQKPKLNLDIVRQIRALSGNVPIVMHGGSGVSEEDLRRSIDAGVRKINYFTYMDKAGAAAVRDRLADWGEGEPLLTKLLVSAEQAMEENVSEAMRVFLKE